MNTSRKRLRKVIWFDPLLNENVKANIGKAFLKLIKQHFPKHHKFIKIFIKEHPQAKLLLHEKHVQYYEAAYCNAWYMKLNFQQKIT